MHKIGSMLFLSFILFISGEVVAQNLLANNGFEDINVCTEYNATCAPEAWYYIKPTEPQALIVPGTILTGRYSMPLPMAYLYEPEKNPPWIYTALLCPLEKGKTYKFSMFINTVGKMFYPIDVGFSRREPTTIGFEKSDLDYTEVIGNSRLVSTATGGWKQVEFSFKAKGGEKFISIGNLAGRPYRFTGQNQMSNTGLIYYFIDELTLLSEDNKLPCADFDRIKTALYNQNARHTDKNFPIFPVEENKPSGKKNTTLPATITSDSLTIPSVYFETNQSDIRKEFQKKIQQLCRALQKKNILTIRIIGHTDNVGSDESNMTLSQNRAISVQNLMSQLLPASASLIQIEYKGRHEPITSNDTPEGRAINRRVEIIVTFKHK